MSPVVRLGLVIVRCVTDLQGSWIDIAAAGDCCQRLRIATVSVGVIVALLQALESMMQVEGLAAIVGVANGVIDVALMEWVPLAGESAGQDWLIVGSVLRLHKRGSVTAC